MRGPGSGPRRSSWLPGAQGRGPARSASAEPRESPRGRRGPAWAAEGSTARTGVKAERAGGSRAAGGGAEGSPFLAAPRGPALLASRLRAGGEAREVEGRACRGPGRGGLGPAEQPREHLRPCGCGCRSPAGGPGQVSGGRAGARGAGCTSCVGRPPLPRRGERGRVWGPAESTKGTLSLAGRGWEGETLEFLLSSSFSRKSGGLKKSLLSGLRREVGCPF